MAVIHLIYVCQLQRICIQVTAAQEILVNSDGRWNKFDFLACLQKKKKKDNLSVAALVKLCILQIVPWAKKIKNEESENIE